MGSGASSEFNAATKAEVVAAAYKGNCQGKYVIVTGGNSGIGKETVKVLSANGAKVVLCSRSVKNGTEAVDEIKKLHPNADITVMQLDLGSFKSIYSFTKEYVASKRPLHILINNAGIMACPKALTEDGFESQFGVNHLGHFLLTNQLLPMLIASGTKQTPSRVVNLSSWANIAFPAAEGLKLDDLSAEKSYLPWERYGASKLANVLFTRELNRRMTLQDGNVISVSVHPGAIISTNLLKDQSISHIGGAFHTIGWKPACLYSLLFQRNKSIAEGASTTVVAALSPNVVPAAHYADCQVSNEVHAKAHDEVFAERLWQISEELVASKPKY